MTTEELVGAAMMQLRSLRVTCTPEIERQPSGETIWLNIFKTEKL